MKKKSPFTTLEVRWFFKHKVAENPPLKMWFETATPFEKQAVEIPKWEPPREDIYLLIPGNDDLGIKWREGQLQIKGRVSSEDEHVFSKVRQGKIEHWIKWSYGHLPPAYKHLFTQDEQSGVITASVRKTRTLRKIALTQKPIEVDLTTDVDRAIEIELSNIEVSGKEFSSLGFEAYPDDSAMKSEFTSVVESFLNDLQGIHLSATQSKSYPAWLILKIWETE